MPIMAQIASVVGSGTGCGSREKEVIVPVTVVSLEVVGFIPPSEGRIIVAFNSRTEKSLRLSAGRLGLEAGKAVPEGSPRWSVIEAPVALACILVGLVALRTTLALTGPTKVKLSPCPLLLASN